MACSVTGGMVRTISLTFQMSVNHSDAEGVQLFLLTREDAL